MKKLYILSFCLFLFLLAAKPENKPYSWDDDLHQRLLTDFCLTESQVQGLYRKYIP